MTTIRRRSRRSPGIPPLALAAAGGLIMLWLVLAIAHLLGLVLVLAGAAAGGYALGLRRRPVTRARISPPQPQDSQLRAQVTGLEVRLGYVTGQLAGVQAERDQLARTVAGQDQRIAELTDACHAAWDAAASAPVRPGPDRDEDAIARLLADPLSGARRIGTG
jgi:hypothetical protein